MISTILAKFVTLAGPDLIVIAIILTVLVAPVAIAIPIVFIIRRRNKKPPPLPPPRPPEAGG